MAVPGFTLGAFILLLHVSSVANYPNGKITNSCHRMIPEHGHSPQSDPVHHISVSQMTFRPGDQIKVTLSGLPFKGFLLEARDTEDLSGSPIGSFTLIDSQVSQLLTCEDIQGSAVSHTNPSKKTEIKVYWNAPSSAPNHIQFLVTVVEKYKIYWVKIPGPIISQPNALPFTTPETTIAHLSTLPPVSHLTKSGDDDAYLCIREEQTVYIQPSHLMGRSHPVMDSRDTLEDMAWRLEDGVMQCSFRRNITLPAVKNRFDLNTSYYIFVADGAADDGRIYKHSQQPLITYEKHDVTDSPKNIGGFHSLLLLKAHGALMFVAWVTTVSIGVLIARFFKPVWSKAFLGKAVWFQVHRMLMLTTSALTCIAFVLPFIYRGGWSWYAGYHPYLGCIVVILAVLQPLLAAFRPPLHDPRRQMFNWTHWSMGTAARIIAVAAMFLGMDLPGLNLPGPWKTYAMIGFVAWHVGTEIVLEIHAYRLSRNGEILDDARIQILQSFTVAEAEGHAFKKAVLAIYICGNVIFLIIFLSAINHL
ncbi:ferric-chelate reductase 1 isoform X2 [Diceros bicornis minor]|uniref:ferric-chelate reductase 1 isoform X2 n=1 Tax=Diceros bicornis minor TaxID=77932 RepID=UPI0026F0E5E9|nr:ferric-chelate reductase 1 isoform X2 [Diceros bicornis minor]